MANSRSHDNLDPSQKVLHRSEKEKKKKNQPSYYFTESLRSNNYLGRVYFV